MISASPRLGALLAGGAALVAFGLTGPAMGDDHGANQDCGPYCHVDGQPSGNGYGNAKHGKEAGSVGKADNKYPPGQAPGGSDNNNGYECDGNGGVGQGNPAHSTCDDTYTQPPPGSYGDSNT